jgi:cell division protein ZapA
MAMKDAATAVRVGDQTYQVRANVDPTELRRLAALVDARIRALVPPGRLIPPSAIVLAAIALVHDLEQERDERAASEGDTRARVVALMRSVDAALDDSSGTSTHAEASNRTRST